MKKQIDIEALLLPISEDLPSGEDLRYTDVYEQIKEARRFDDPLDQGDWKTERKAADWEKAIALCVKALSERTKDLQVAAWLTEAMIITEGFSGLAAGLDIVSGLLEKFWETLYPEIEEGDLDYRVAPLEFLNEKLWTMVKQVPITDPGKTPGYSWLRWQESRETGSETDTRDKFGETDESKKRRRDELIQEGRLTGEEFDSAMNATSPAFYMSLNDGLGTCLEAFKRLDALVDEKFGNNAPRLAELGKAIEDCAQVVQRICKERGVLAAPVAEEATPREESTAYDERPAGLKDEEQEMMPELREELGQVPAEPADARRRGAQVVSAAPVMVSSDQPSPLTDASPWEQFLWEDAVRLTSGPGVKKALERLLEAALNAPSVRERNRLKLLEAKLCLKAGRTDLARPILEQLNTVVDQLQLEQWESPVWIGEVLGSLYQCLMSGEPSDDDYNRAFVLFQKLCTIDITKALTYRKE